MFKISNSIKPKKESKVIDNSNENDIEDKNIQLDETKILYLLEQNKNITENVEYNIENINLSPIDNLDNILLEKLETEKDSDNKKTIEKTIEQIVQFKEAIDSLKNKITENKKDIKNSNDFISDLNTAKEILLYNDKNNDFKGILELIKQINNFDNTKNNEIKETNIIPNKLVKTISKIAYVDFKDVDQLTKFIDEKIIIQNSEKLGMEKEELEELMDQNPELIIDRLSKIMKDNGCYKISEYLEDTRINSKGINKFALITLLGVIIFSSIGNNISADIIPHFQGLNNPNGLNNLMQDTNIYFDQEIKKVPVLNTIFDSIKTTNFSISDSLINNILSSGYKRHENNPSYFYNPNTHEYVCIWESSDSGDIVIFTDKGNINIQNGKLSSIYVNEQNFNFDMNAENLNVIGISKYENNGNVEHINKDSYSFYNKGIHYEETKDNKTISITYSGWYYLSIKMNNKNEVEDFYGLEYLLGDKERCLDFINYCEDNNIQSILDLMPGTTFKNSFKIYIDSSFFSENSIEGIESMVRLFGGPTNLENKTYANFSLYSSMYKIKKENDGKTNNNINFVDELVNQMKTDFPDLFYGSENFDFNRTMALLSLIDSLNYDSYDITNMNKVINLDLNNVFGGINELNKKTNEGIAEDLLNEITQNTNTEKNGGVCGHYAAFIGMMAERFLGENTALAMTSGTHVLATIKNPATNNICIITWGKIVDTNIDSSQIKNIYDAEIAIARFMTQPDLTGFIADPNTGKIIVKVLVDSLTEKYRSLTGWDNTERLSAFSDKNGNPAQGFENTKVSKDNRIEYQVDDALKEITGEEKEKIKEGKSYIKFTESNYGKSIEDTEHDFIAGEQDNTEFITGAEGKNIQVLIDLTKENGLIKTPFSNNLFFNIGILTSIFSAEEEGILTMVKEDRLTIDIEHSFKKEYLLKAIDAALTIGTVNKADVSIATDETMYKGYRGYNEYYGRGIRYPSANFSNTTFVRLDKDININEDNNLFISTLFGFEASTMNKVTALDGFYLEDFCKLSLLLESHKNAFGLDFKYNGQEGQKKLSAKISADFKEGLIAGTKGINVALEGSSTIFNERIKKAGNIDDKWKLDLSINVKL